MPDSSSTDMELWLAIKAGSEKGFSLLFDKYWLRLYKTACYFLKDEDESKDLVHNVFMSIWQRRLTLEIENIVPYLNAATRFEVYRCLKKRKASIVTYVDELPVDLQDYVENEALFKMQKSDLEIQLNEQLEKLPKRCAAIYYMSKIQQLKNEEIAAQLGINKHTVENQLSYAMKHMQVALKKLPLIILMLRSFDL